jgi:hypothetical protein
VTFPSFFIPFSASFSFLASSKTLAFLVFPDAQGLEVSGPERAKDDYFPCRANFRPRTIILQKYASLVVSQRRRA